MPDIIIQQSETETPAELETVAEAEAEALEQAIETVSDNEVTIAAIEADKEIAIAEIQAEARIAEAEAYSEAQQETQITWTDFQDLRSTVEALAASQAEMTAAMAVLLTPISSPLEAETVEAVEMNDLTPQSMSAPTSETQMEVIDESAEESPALAIEVAGKPIIRLV